MVFKTGCKINLGLRILSKRDDGYHNISTIFYPIDCINDLIEIVPAEEDQFSCSGIMVDCPAEKNLCMVALKRVREHYNFPKCKIHLHKCIPFGAGLGAGSANAMGVIEGINQLFTLRMSLNEKIAIGSLIGSDVPFFAIGRPQIASGRGEIMQDLSLSLKGLYIQIAKPEGSVSTKEAYSSVVPDDNIESIEEIIKRPVENWKDNLINDFEPSVFKKLNDVKLLKDYFYKNGALYASMSGSGSSVFGIFREKPITRPESIIMEGTLPF